MPTFMDWHEGGLKEDLRRTVESRVRSGERDQFGVVDRGVIMDRDANRTYCILDAPDAEAVRRHHEAAGLTPHDIHRADTMLPSSR